MWLLWLLATSTCRILLVLIFSVALSMLKHIICMFLHIITILDHDIPSQIHLGIQNILQVRRYHYLFFPFCLCCYWSNIISFPAVIKLSLGLLQYFPSSHINFIHFSVSQNVLQFCFLNHPEGFHYGLISQSHLVISTLNNPLPTKCESSLKCNIYIYVSVHCYWLPGIKSSPQESCLIKEYNL